MEKHHLETLYLTGIALPHKTSNTNGQSMKDCGQLWQEFEKGGWFVKIPERIEDKVYAVYYDYEGDHTQPYSYFIGCRVAPGAPVPEGMENIVIPPRDFINFTAKGKMPDCVAKEWKNIWESGMQRAYKADFEVYDERSHDWYDAEVDIFIGV
ncbi:AraC family transcriptional regulator [Flavobacterium salilacus subsp. salilacus]|uniref:GyrI-like domain-containing protein n=1 Tax=Flavobacterium TaxID=237 RepID=UPI001075889D|nr:MULTISPECIES: GyrI-like domain-containing protein [Flavobacterium]KAF2519499.1 AraC family transcriptional regulator [Flavobacterium salilacus subsp. salilacus]MBE1614603.1 AraC family transcriptional regulator [Flavobacterium sp. SaA2.13]